RRERRASARARANGCAGRPADRHRSPGRSVADPMHTKLFIDGRWLDPIVAAVLPVVDPATEETIAEVSAGSRADVDLAVHAARKAYARWRTTSGRERAGYLRAMAREIRARARELTALSSRNNGKPLAEADIDIGDAIATYEYYATL